jgi:hypothetical protein
MDSRASSGLLFRGKAGLRISERKVKEERRKEEERADKGRRKDGGKAEKGRRKINQKFESDRFLMSNRSHQMGLKM